MASRNDPFNTVWTRPHRPRSGQPALSREQIVSAALQLLDAEGSDGLSMRRLGTKLGSGATSIYWHVANKDELLDLVIDAVMGEVQVPDPVDGDWRTAVRTMAIGMRAMILRHPWMTSTFGTRPTMGPNALRLSDRALALLTAAGFNGLDVALAGNLLSSYAIGVATIEASWRTVAARTGTTEADVVKMVDEFQETLSGQYPNYEQWWRENRAALDLEKSYEQSFEFGLERLLDGLESWLERSRRT
jgi:AcrR family transcriptional regulator